MPRMPRVVIPEIPLHVTQRGNRQEDVFFCDADRRLYLELLGKYSAEHGLAIQAYCLMSNHVHLVVVPRQADSLARALKPVDLRYAQHVNWTRGLTGRLWQSRPFSCPLDERHFWAAVRYVERNPVRARVVRQAQQYRWSSAAGHCGLRKDPLLSGDLELSEQIPDWAAWLRDDDDAEMLARLRLHTRTGRPAGSDGFIKKIERLCGRILRAKPVGRPRKRKRRDK